MKHFSLLVSIFLLPLVVIAEESVDFSKSYLTPSVNIDEIRIEGVQLHSENATRSRSMLLKYDPQTDGCHIEHSYDHGLDARLFEQQLLNTLWTGTYRSTSNVYFSELFFNTIQNGIVAGVMLHKTGDLEEDLLLRATVVGEIFTQYFVDPKDGEEPMWLFAGDYYSRLAEDSEDKLPETAEVVGMRQFIDLKRSRAIEHRPANRWGTNKEYRLILENGMLTGSVGTPKESYTNNREMTNVGLIELTQPLLPEE